MTKLLMFFFAVQFLTGQANGYNQYEISNRYPSHCPFVLYHLVMEEDFSSIEYLLDYEVKVDPPLSDNCFDPIYKSLPEGSTLLHVLAHRFEDHRFNRYPIDQRKGDFLRQRIVQHFQYERIFLYQRIFRLLVTHGANPSIVDANGDSAKDLSLFMKCHTHSTMGTNGIYHCVD